MHSATFFPIHEVVKGCGKEMCHRPSVHFYVIDYQIQPKLCHTNSYTHSIITDNYIARINGMASDSSKTDPQYINLYHSVKHNTTQLPSGRLRPSNARKSNC